jgi:dimeric dUTPase (all-alpha-NTP-PPase superfamily)
MFSFSDYQFGHKFIPGYNESHIDGRRLEEIDEKMREEFYRENGPVALSSLLVMWRGFMNLKDSTSDAEVRAATFNYWMVRRNIQRVILASFAFNGLVFTRCSEQFLSRLAEMFVQVDQFTPPDTAINRKYQAVFEMYDRMNSARSKAVARKMADAFIRRHAGGPLPQDIIDAAVKPAIAPL